MFDFLSPKWNKGLKFETLVLKKFDFLSPKLNKGLKFETLVRKRFDFLSAKRNKDLKFEILVRNRFDYLSALSKRRLKVETLVCKVLVKRDLNPRSKAILRVCMRRACMQEEGRKNVSWMKIVP